MNKTIMIVDDNEDVRYTVVRGLQQLEAPYTCVEAESGVDCLRQLDEGVAPDLFLVDIMMPQMDGWQLIEHLRSRDANKDTPILILTAKSGDISKGLSEIHAADYVAKPFDIVDLRNRIDDIVQ